MRLTHPASALLVACLAGCGVHAVRSSPAPCRTAQEVGRLVRADVLPVWTTVTPEELSAKWPGGLRRIAEGPSVVWAQIGDGCAAYFTFGPRAASDGVRLDLVRLLREGSRIEVFADAKSLAPVFGPGLTTDEGRELNEELSVSTSWRVPPDIDLPAVWSIRTLNIRQNPRQRPSERGRWQLEVMFSRRDDPPAKREH